jgi:hypothetical protein
VDHEFAKRRDGHDSRVFRAGRGRRPHLRDHCKLWSVYLACAVGILVTGAAGRGAEDPELKS